MAPPPRQRLNLSKERFSQHFSTLKTQTYLDPSLSRAAFHGIRSIAWNPTGSLIATGSSDRTLRVWNPDRPNVKYSTELRGHAAGIEKVAFNPKKEAELCSASSDGVVKFWDVKTKTVINEVKDLGDPVTLIWHPDGESLIVGNKADKIYVLSPTSPTPVSEHQQDVQINQICFTWCGKYVFVTTGEGQTRILRYPSFDPFKHQNYKPFAELSLRGHTSSCLSVELQPTGRYLATGGSDAVIALYDTKDWICQRTLIDMTGPVRSISFSFDGSYIVGGSDEGSALEIAHTETGETVHSVKTGGPSPVVAWHPFKYMLAYADSGSLKIIGGGGEPERR